MSNVIIIGASSGIGRELAKQYGQNKENCLGLIARREKELISLSQEIQAQSKILAADLEQESRASLISDFYKSFDHIDLIIYCAGYGEINPLLNWELCRKTLEVNVMAFTEIINLSYNYLSVQGSGHIAAITSIAAFRGSRNDSGYSASKSYILKYLEGMSSKARKEKQSVNLTTIIPGFVDTRMAKGDGIFWMCLPQTAAKIMISGLKKKKRYIYVTRRWKLIALLLKLLPWQIYERL